MPDEVYDDNLLVFMYEWKYGSSNVIHVRSRHVEKKHIEIWVDIMYYAKETNKYYVAQWNSYENTYLGEDMMPYICLECNSLDSLRRLHDPVTYDYECVITRLINNFRQKYGEHYIVDYLEMSLSDLTPR